MLAKSCHKVVRSHTRIALDFVDVVYPHALVQHVALSDWQSSGCYLMKQVWYLFRNEIVFDEAQDRSLVFRPEPNRRGQRTRSS